MRGHRSSAAELRRGPARIRTGAELAQKQSLRCENTVAVQQGLEEGLEEHARKRCCNAQKQSLHSKCTIAVPQSSEEGLQ